MKPDKERVGVYKREMNNRKWDDSVDRDSNVSEIAADNTLCNGKARKQSDGVDSKTKRWIVKHPRTSGPK